MDYALYNPFAFTPTPMDTICARFAYINLKKRSRAEFEDDAPGALNIDRSSKRLKIAPAGRPRTPHSSFAASYRRRHDTRLSQSFGARPIPILLTAAPPPLVTVVREVMVHLCEEATNETKKERTARLAWNAHSEEEGETNLHAPASSSAVEQQEPDSMDVDTMTETGPQGVGYSSSVFQDITNTGGNRSHGSKSGKAKGIGENMTGGRKRSRGTSRENDPYPTSSRAKGKKPRRQPIPGGDDRSGLERASG
ncbi:hypothetical protein B0H11DRAFT_1929384 [Mycena galericulata]|nr:hypothetical protein B0H11DRAFT_1929384 [Mycena galericulata]